MCAALLAYRKNVLGPTGKLFAPILQVTTGQLWIQG